MNVEKLLQELAAAYPDATTATEGGRTLVKILKVDFPRGCMPGHSSVLVVLEVRSAAPQLYVKELPKLANGGTPRSTSSATVGGESWQTFSFNQPWDENKNTAIQFVEGRLRRFALNE